MPMDIDYFTENDLSKMDVYGFYLSLPNHLRSLFKASLHVSLEPGNTMQGYKGPASHCNGSCGEVLNSYRGIQEIRFWYGLAANLKPLSPFAFGITRWIQSSGGQLEWTTMYFDEANGNAVTETEATRIKQKNKEAEEANDKGLKLCKEGKFRDAFEWFKKAFQGCSSGYNRESEYKNNRDATNIALDAQKHLNNEEFLEAARKFQEAYILSSVSEIYSVFSRCRDSAKKRSNKAADNFFNQGKNQFNQGKYSEAKILFIKAAESCTSDYCNKSTFLKNVDIAENCIKPINLYKECNELWKKGWIAENKNNPEEAASKFQKAKSKIVEACNLAADSQEYKLLKQMINLKINGNELFNEGLKLQDKGNELRQSHLFDEANKKYQEASNKYKDAKLQFEQGFDICGNKDFLECINILRKNVEEISVWLQNFESTQQHDALKALTIKEFEQNDQLQEVDPEITDFSYSITRMLRLPESD